MCTDKLKEGGLAVAWDPSRGVDTTQVELGLWNGKDTISTVRGQLSVERSLTDSILRTTKVGGHIEQVLGPTGEGGQP